MKLMTKKFWSAPADNYQDSQGLFLKKRDKAHGRWVFRYTLGKRREMSLWLWPAATLANAPDLAAEARVLVKNGIGPTDARQDIAISRAGETSLTDTI